MRRLTALGLFVAAVVSASLAQAQQPLPQPTSSTGGVQPLPPPTTTGTTSAAPTQTTPPPPPPLPSATATVTASATVTAPPPPPPPPTVTATATTPPPPPPPTATATATTTAPPPPPPPTATATGTTTAPPPPPPVMVVPPAAQRRDDGEMAFLYATSGAFGITTGAWIDTLSLCSPNNKKKNPDGTTFIDPKTGTTVNQCDPAGALVSPLLLGTLFPLGFFLWDNFYKGGIHRGVPSSISTGLIIGALEGLGVAGANYAIAGDTTGKRWGSDGIMTSVWVGSALGGIGGYAFGEAVRPDPRKIALIASGAGWGALMGATFGGGVADSDGPSVAQGMLVGNLIGINVGVLTTGVLAAAGYDPSWQSLKYMWLGAGIGLLGTSAIIYPIYLATGQQDQTLNCGDPTNRHGCPLVNHGMVANSFGMLAGVVIAGILTRDLKDPEPVPVPQETAPPPPQVPSPNAGAPSGPTAKREKPWTPPFTLSVSPLQNGGMVGVQGQW